MKATFTCFVFLFAMRLQAQPQVDFDRYFTDETLRIDFYHSGDSKSEEFIPDKMYRQGSWAGNPANCTQPLPLGVYRVDIYDRASNLLIYSNGYSSIFAEYQTTGPAVQGIKKIYHESVLIPSPRRTFLLIIERRDRQNIPVPVYSQSVEINDYHIIKEKLRDTGDIVVPVVNNGNPHTCVDLVILAEGYQSAELEKFRNDLKYFTNLFFSTEPYKSRKKLFNISGIFSASAESGTDEPRQGIYRNTRLSSSFNTFDLDRYCLDEDNKSIRDVAARVPYDAILIMVNKDRYGGGGIYNWQTVFCTGSSWHDYVFLHEFGHAFAGLGDEYFTSPVAYEDFITPGVEPLDPNITILLDSADVKWKMYLSPGIQVPTEWGKNKYESLLNRINALNAERDNVTGKMVKSGATRAEIDKTQKAFQDSLSRASREADNFINNHPLKDKVGVFEGANYTSKGFYRPTLMSLMHKFNEHDKTYGIVNEQAIINAIRYYTGTE